MTNFTKGPWTFEQHENGCAFITSDYALTGDIADLYHKTDKGEILPKQNAEADGHLIAAAPDMYEALLFLEENKPFQGSASWFVFMDIMKEALKKARGENAT